MPGWLRFIVQSLPLMGGIALSAYVAASSWSAGVWFAGFVLVLYLSGREAGRAVVLEAPLQDTHTFYLVSEPERFKPIEVAGIEDPVIEDTLGATLGTAGDLALLVHRRTYEVHLASVRRSVRLADWSVCIVMQWQGGYWRIVWPTTTGGSGGGRRRREQLEEEEKISLVPELVPA